MRGKMKKYSLNKIPMILASLGLFAGIQAEDATLDRVPADCTSLCADKPNFDCSRDFNFNAAAIYEQVRVQGGEPAFITNSRDQTYFPVNGFGVQQPEIASWGFKLGAGYTGWSDQWTTAVKYSYFQAVSDTAMQNAYGSAFIPSVYVNQNVDNGQNALVTSFGNLQLGNKTIINDVKFTIGRPTLVTERVSVDIYSSVEATIISRRQVQQYTNDVASGNIPVTQFSVTQRYAAANGGYFQNYQKYTWWGVGPGIGSKVNYLLGKGVSVYGDASGSIKYGLISTRTSTISSPKSGSTGLEAILMSNLYQFSPGVEFELGLQWSYTFDEEQTKVGFCIAYENQYYFMTMRTLVPESAVRTENGAGLGLQGLVLQGMLEF
ncbi:MAG: hypothetical protein EB053_06215 [Chlamydiae bacterium]|nr:hypothetical protein [Chlamydiota bacterium]